MAIPTAPVMAVTVIARIAIAAIVTGIVAAVVIAGRTTPVIITRANTNVERRRLDYDCRWRIIVRRRIHWCGINRRWTANYNTREGQRRQGQPNIEVNPGLRS